jgi:hypothetical protein
LYLFIFLPELQEIEVLSLFPEIFEAELAEQGLLIVIQAEKHQEMWCC